MRCLQSDANTTETLSFRKSPNMTPVKRTVAALLMLAIPLLAAGRICAGEEKKLGEADLFKLVELKLDDKAVVAKVEQGLDFTVDDALMTRLKKAGAAEAVLAAVRKAGDAKAPAGELKDDLMLWVSKPHGSGGSFLKSEVLINGQKVGAFENNAQVKVDKYLKKGANLITVKTAPRSPLGDYDRGLYFQVGQVHKEGDREEQVMTPVLWQFPNYEGWQAKDGKATHDLGPDVKEVTNTFTVVYAGCDADKAKTAAGDYVLQGGPTNTASFAAAPSTVIVNGTPLTSFYGSSRQVVLTPYLKKGENKLEITTKRVTESLDGRDYAFNLVGPMEYSVKQKKLIGPKITEFRNLEGWKNDPKTGQLVNSEDPKSDTVKQVVTFILEEAPKAK